MSLQKLCQVRKISTGGRLRDLVLLRHGESEGNVARNRSIGGDHSLYTGEFKHRHSALWRLTDRGREQAIAAGDWLRSNGLYEFDRYYVSEYLRAMETAARLNLNDAKWYAEMLIRERDWGQMDLLSEKERVAKFMHELQRRDLDPFYFSPPGGESLAAVAQRADRLVSSLHRECNGKKAIVVCHGEVMWAMRTRLERMGLDHFRDLQESGRMVDQIHNGHILHYTRVDPHTGEVHPFFLWMRSVCPWDTKLSPKGWLKIDRPVYDNELLLAAAERVPRMIVSDEYLTKTYAMPTANRKKRTGKQPFNSEEPKQDIQNNPYQVEPLQLKKVLFVNKTTRYEHEQELHGHTGEALKKQISLRGFVYERLLASYLAHTESLDELCASFKKEGIQVQVVKSSELSHDHVHQACAVISAGGDGTFLQAASFANDQTPVIGLNTDPTRSEGKLCCYSIDPSREKVNALVKKLLSGQFRWRYRQRIRVVLVHQDGKIVELPRYALNEVFMSEADPSRPTFYDLGVDQNQREPQRSSGIIISTGTGSSAWYYSACQIHREQVSSVLKSTHHVHVNEAVTEITQELNKENVFDENSLDMGYIVREPIINATFGDIYHRQGLARRISMRSLGWDVRLHLDGIYSTPLEYGVQAVMRIGNEPNYQLRTVEFEPENPKAK